MLNKVIAADTIDRAVDKVVDELKKDDAAGTTSSSASRHHVIYFDGWDGLGASAVLRAVGRRLTPEAGSSASAAAGLGFAHVFHIDCSKWKSRRAMQKMIAEQLKLPDSVMEMFDAQDEDDNFRAIGKGSRAEIPQVAEEIIGQIQKLNGRFLLIFHNGSNEEIDLSSFGFPLYDRYSKSKVLWSFQGRFRAYPRTKVDEALKKTTLTDVFLSAEYSSNIGHDELSEILHHEAEEVAHEMINLGGNDWHAAAVNCFLYTMKLCRMDNDLTDYDLATHVCNYWRCDGIIHLQQGDFGNDDGVDQLWLSCDALHREMRLDVDNYRNPHFSCRVERRLLKRVAYWTSTYRFMQILDPHGQIPEGMFQQFNKLSVLKLSACEFSFASPPFLCCQNLRFLYLDRCQERSSTDEAVKEDEERSSTDGAVKEDDTHQFLQRLWVLDVRYSKGAFLSQDMTHLRELNVVGAGGWLDMDLFRGQLCNIRKLRVTKFQNIHNHKVLFSGMEKLELLEFSENESVRGWIWLFVENCNNLESVIIYGSTCLYGIFLMGCPKLKKLFLIGSFPKLGAIGIAGGAVEILDLSSVTAPVLERVYLLECEKLCAILWPSSAERNRNLSRLCIDMKQKEGSTADTSRPPGDLGYWDMAREKKNFDWHISVRDARILQSLEPVIGSFSAKDAHVEVSTISSPTHPCADDAAAGSKDGGMRSSSGQHVQVKQKQPKDTAMYPDVAVALKEIRTQQQQQEEANGGHNSSDAPVTMSICPPRPDLPSEGCYINIEDHLRTRSQAASVTLPGFICDGAKILHVHDSLHATSILEVPSASATWNQLEWCRVERCPKLECVFSPQLGGGMAERSNNDIDMFKNLKTVWASDLPNARYIWNWTWTGPTGPLFEAWDRSRTFEGLALLHLGCCPRLINIVRFPVVDDAFGRLERLEIMWCGDLSVAFHFYDPQFRGCIFPKLKHVYLHELPNLQNTGSIGLSISMPELETIKIRGCWSLKRLPTIESANVVECDCEKEWWDGLKWGSEEHARHYKPIHPRYYKKTMLRGSALR